jgi:hypothetical protein
MNPLTAIRRASSTSPLAFSFFVLAMAALFVAGPWPTRVALADQRRLPEAVATISASVSTTAAVVAAVSGKKICVKSMVLRSSTAGVMVFTDGSGGTTLANIYLAQDTNLVLDEHVLGEGFKTTAGNALHAVLSGATLTATIRYAQE